jgi:adenosylmethionine-8-amino-7-oxononanoate aminotransferase
VQVPTPDARLAGPGESAEAYALRCAGALEAHLAAHADETAAFIVEPLVQGAAGMAMYHPAYLTRVRELCDRYQVHLIADEIAVGFGRTGTLFACEQAPIRPDFICLSKGITGGYLPLSAVLTTDDVYAAFYGDATARGFLHSHSYTGNPLACRAALAVLDIFEHDNVIAANRVKAIEFTGILSEVAAHTRVRHFRYLGMIWAFDVADATPGFSARFHQAALAQGVFMRPIGGTVYVMPPYVTSADEMRGLADAMLACLSSPDV